MHEYTTDSHTPSRGFFISKDVFIKRQKEKWVAPRCDPQLFLGDIWNPDGLVTPLILFLILLRFFVAQDNLRGFDGHGT